MKIDFPDLTKLRSINLTWTGWKKRKEDRSVKTTRGRRVGGWWRSLAGRPPLFAAEVPNVGETNSTEKVIMVADNSTQLCT